MLYDFKCMHCSEKLAIAFPVSEYDQKVAEDGRLKRKKCKKCQSILFYRHIIKAPAVLGGTNGYMSMERWQQKNPDHTKRKEDELHKKMSDSHRKKVLDRINKQSGGGRRDQRHKDYGKGQGEDKLKSNE